MSDVRRLSVAPTVRLNVVRRSGGACESCRLEWPWALYLFRVQEEGPDIATNLVILCSRCSDGRNGPFLALIGQRSPRAKLKEANNRRAAVAPLTPSRRRALIAARGARCEACGMSGTERPLEVHHKVAVLQGGHDGDDNLEVLCFACHRRLQPCITGCGAWTKRAAGLCQNCLVRKRLEALIPEATWEEIKARFPAFVRQWKPGYEPKPLNSEEETRLEAGRLAQLDTASLEERWLTQRPSR
jgi:5-methylcytosine-specific restriction endonuclease McrA